MKIKTRVVDFLNMLAEDKIKPNTKIKYAGLTYIVDYPNLCGIYEECAEPKKENSLFSKLDICSLNYEVEIIEDKKEIDIQSIEEFGIDDNEYIKTKIGSFKTRKMDIAFLHKINELVQAVKQLDKKLKR